MRIEAWSTLTYLPPLPSTENFAFRMLVGGFPTNPATNEFWGFE